MAYALFDRDRQIGQTWPTEEEVWKHALQEGLIADVPVADEEDDQVLPIGCHVKEVVGIK